MSSITGSRVLIVDDLAGNRSILSRLLTDYQTVEAESGEEALRIIADVCPDIILLDIKMPGLDGFEVCRRLKGSPDTAEIPVIFITGVDTPGLAGKCLKIGAVDFITKPFDLEEVKARVRTHLTLRKTSTELLVQNQLLEEKIKEQRLSSQLARHVLELIDLSSPRNIKLSGDIYMFVHAMACACSEEGGDHYLIKTRPNQDGGQKTLVSLKDQSGHSVNCILRSIITDLLHNSILYNNPKATMPQSVTLLNDTICSTGLFAGDDFFTALFLEIDHESKTLDFISAGHPAFYLIRNGTVKRLPEREGEGINMPVGILENIHFKAGREQLLEGDRLLLFTDGLTEMPMSNKGKALQAQELHEIIQEKVDSDQEITVSALMNFLPTAILQKGGAVECNDSQHLYDDVTMVGLELTKISGEDWRVFVPADYDGIDGLVEAVFLLVQNLAANIGCEFDDFTMRTVLTEGILNAWKHGNGRDQAKPISVGWQVGNDFCLFIKDQGEGFDSTWLKNPVQQENRLFESGRGIFCMKKYADFVGWQDGGSTLLLSFQTTKHPWGQVDRTPGSRIDLWKNSQPEL